MPGANQYKAQQFIDAIENSGGIIATIAKRVGCDWHTAQKYIREYATVAQAYADECEKLLDTAESVVIGEIIKEKDVTTAKWYLTMKGRERGYAKTERREIMDVDLSTLTTDQLERIASGEDPAHVIATSGKS